MQEHSRHKVQSWGVWATMRALRGNKNFLEKMRLGG